MTSTIYVLIKPEHENTITIDVSESDYAELNPFKITKVHINEKRVMCDSFPNGVFPGAEIINHSTQTTKINCFSNYFEFSKIVEDEVTHLEGKDYLNTTFFQRREDGWKGFLKLGKPGTVKGFFIDGGVYHVEDEYIVKDIVYKQAYGSLIKGKKCFKKIVNILKTKSIVLSGLDEYYLEALKTVLTEAIY